MGTQTPAEAAWQPDPQALAALAEFAAGAGHEINNPLATIIGRAQQLLRDEADPQRRHSLAVIAAQAYRVRDMIGDVMAFARPPSPQRSVVDVVPLTRDVVARLAESMRAVDCTAVCDFPAELLASVDPAQWSVVVSELLRNAVEAQTDRGGTVRLRLAATGADWTFSVIDSGRGFSELERRHAFDPFFSGRQAGRGLGFGLCKIWQIVRLHGGDVSIRSNESETCVATVIPIDPVADKPTAVSDETF